MHQLHLCREVSPTPIDECPGYDTKPSDSEVPVLELWGMRITPSLPLLPGPFWPGVVIPDRALLWVKQMTYAELFEIELFLHLTVC